MGADVSIQPDSAGKAHLRAMVVPREHGAWGLLLVPLFTGATVAIASDHRIWPLVLFTVAALALFWLRTPVENLLGTTPLKAQTVAERKLVLMASLALAAVSAGSLAGLLWNGRNWELLFLGGVAAVAFVVQALLKKFIRKARTAAQLVGAIGLTCTAPAAYYVASGRLDKRAFVLWAANWVFAGNQIHFVQLRIHAARTATFCEKMGSGADVFPDSDPAAPDSGYCLAPAFNPWSGDPRLRSGALSRSLLVFPWTPIAPDTQSGLVGDEAGNPVRPSFWPLLSFFLRTLRLKSQNQLV